MSETKKSNICARCGGGMSSGSLKMGKEDATIVIAGEPDGFLGVIPYTSSKITARVCKDCGAIELFARDVRDLLRVTAGSD